MKNLILIYTLILLIPVAALAQSTAFTFQGRLNDGSAAAAGNVQLEIKLYDSLAGGAQIGSTVNIPSVPLINGVFSTELDFGATAFDGSPRFLEIGVRPAGSTNPYTILSPRQHLSSVPYATQSKNAAQLGGVDADQYVTNATVGSAFIRNGTTAQTGNFNIDGNGIISGNVGIGTTTPMTRFQVKTGTGLYGLTHTDGAITVGSYVGNSSSGAFGGWLGTQSNHKLFFFTNNGQPAMTVDTTGNVGIGTTTPSPGIKLDVVGNVLMTLANGAVQFGSPNAETGMTTIFGNRRADVRLDGATLKLVVGLAGVGPPPSTNGIIIDAQGRVGIGTTPSVGVGRLQAVSSDPVPALYGENTASDIGILGVSSNNGKGVVGSNANLSGFGVYSDGYLGVGILAGGGNTTVCRNSLNQIAFCSSSLRYKKDLQPFGDGLSFINRLRPMAYKWKADNLPDIGFGAEDVAKINPLFVTYNDKGKVEGVKYDRLSVVFVNAFKEQQAQIEKQRIQIENLKKLICLDHPGSDICHEK